MIQRLLNPRRLASSQEGGALIEMAIIAPFLALLLVGLVEYGRYAYLSILVGNAARTGVQYGAQNLVTANDNAGMQNAALNDGQNVPGLSITATHYCTCADGSASTCQPTDCPASHRITFVQVNATGAFTPMLNYPEMPSTLKVSSQAVMRLSQ